MDWGKKQAQELKIQEAFLKFMASTLKGYRAYLLPITKAPTVGTTDPQALFQLNDFLKSRDKAHHKFFVMLMKTQMFIRFIEESSFVADGDQGLTFFDECIEKLSHEENSEAHLIEHDIVHKSDRTVFVLPPEPTNNQDSYKYHNFTLNPSLLICKKKCHFSSLHQTNIPGSPMARRTKHEIKSAQKLAKKCVRSPEMWAKCLCGTCYTLYFMVLPSMLSLSLGKEKTILQQAYELLVRATQQHLSCDEVCYRLMMQLCGEHSKPLLAVKLLVLMKKHGIQPNALTYGLYNRCVLEAEWPAHSGSSQLLWNKLRNVVLGAAQFKWAARRKVAQDLSASTESGSCLLDATGRALSCTSLDSHETVQTDNKLLGKVFKVANIVKNSFNGSDPNVVDTSSDYSGSNEDIEVLEEPVNEKNNTLNDSRVDYFTPPESPSEYRILSRSESAGDANIIDKFQQNNKKNCSRVLHFNGNATEVTDDNINSPGKMSARTAITENDPLGAFKQAQTSVTTVTHPEIPSLTPNPILTDDPILFRSSVHRSATFEGSPPTQNKLHRSETVPAATVTSSLASLGSSFKIGFSPSSFTGRKSELIQGSISTIKSAATTVVKKLDEIKEAISTSSNSTPVKAHGNDKLTAGDAIEDGECHSTDGSEGGERHRRISAEFCNYRGSYTNLKDSDEALPDSMFPVPSEEKKDCEVDITLTSCSQCHNCMCLLYDEDIMANWSAEDSNLNTLCQACNKTTVPLLTVTVKERDVPAYDPFSIPYLNPLVLRKELENILSQEGDLCVANPKFVDEHPIIYWNLTWAFERINVQTHLPNLYLLRKNNSIMNMEKKSNSIVSVTEKSDENSSNMQPVEEGTDPLTQELFALEQMSAQVSVHCLWDEPRLHSEGPPMYMIWKLRDTAALNSTNRKTVTKQFMQKIITSIRLNDLNEPLKYLASEREKCQSLNSERTKCQSSTHSVYRDILFLACKALGRDQIDLNSFDRVYSSAYSRVKERSERHSKLFGPRDKPITLNSLYCRQLFRPLSLV